MPLSLPHDPLVPVENGKGSGHHLQLVWLFKQKIQPYFKGCPNGVRLFHLFIVGYSSCCPFENTSSLT